MKAKFKVGDKVLYRICGITVKGTIENFYCDGRIIKVYPWFFGRRYKIRNCKGDIHIVFENAIIH